MSLSMRSVSIICAQADNAVNQPILSAVQALRYSLHGARAIPIETTVPLDLLSVASQQTSMASATIKHGGHR
eukprot:scaffold114759_cov18-Prasinocladus_malaysianus.AAC.1